jgi:hypothetical protein
MQPAENAASPAAFFVLAGAFVFEATSLGVALHSAHAERHGRPLLRFIRETRDPTLPTVLLEDSAALRSILVAAAGLGLARVTGEPRWDGAALIGLILVASRSSRSTPCTWAPNAVLVSARVWFRPESSRYDRTPPRARRDQQSSIGGAGPGPPPVQAKARSASGVGSVESAPSSTPRSQPSKISNGSAELIRRSHTGRPPRYRKITLASLQGPRQSLNARRARPSSPAWRKVRSIWRFRTRGGVFGPPRSAWPQQQPMQARISAASAMVASCKCVGHLRRRTWQSP